MYQRNMERLMVKWETAKDLVPAPQLYQESNQSDIGMLFFGTSTYSAEEAMDDMKSDGIAVDAIRLKAFPFNKDVEEFIASHERVFVIEQNRDAQMRGLLILELEINPAKLIPILNYDGMPITAHQIVEMISKQLTPSKPQYNDLSTTRI